LDNVKHGLTIVRGDVEKLGNRDEFKKLRYLLREAEKEIKKLSNERWFN
jgi:hypothetical protein